jgi:glycosyltransferase involved in cell wall biosynthesis
MRILLISYDFPPSANAHAFRWYPIVCEWLVAGHTVDVVAGLETLGTDLPTHTNLSVHRVGSRLLNRLRSTVPGAPAAPAPMIAKGSPLNRWLRGLYRIMYWPDGLWHWYPFAIAKARELTRHPVDVAVTYSPTFVCHLVGHHLKRAGRARFWLADYGDPFSLSDAMPVNNFRLFGNLSRAWDARVIQTADMTSFTNRQTSELYRQMARGKELRVIPHAIPPSFIQAVSPHKQAIPRTLAYVGALHPVIREPDAAIRLLLSALDIGQSDMTIQFVGRTNGVRTVEDPRIHWVGEVSKSDAVEYMRNADVLIHIENKNVPMTPSKVAEYISTGKPIINFVHRDGTELLMDWRCTYNVFLDAPPTAEEIADFLSKEYQPPAADEIAAHIGMHDASTIAHELTSVFQRA